ncbi:MAG TPA: acyl-CoA dehydrogenase family protein [Xanthomonadales bacterium]|nr:acyl-CoA dehydrogenase family protein [Xanthomonadales bacterium]
MDYESTLKPSPYYNETHHEWRRQLRRFVQQEIEPNVNAWDREDEYIPRELFRKAGELGIYRIGFPEEYGGYGDEMDIFHDLLSVEEFHRPGSGAMLTTLFVPIGGLPPINALGSDELKRKVLPEVLSGREQISVAITEPGAGSDIGNLQSRARREGDDWVISGSKIYITGGMTSRWITVVARTGEGKQGLSIFLVEADSRGLEKTVMKKMGMWASDTAMLFFDDVRVPGTHLIGKEGDGFRGMLVNLNGERLRAAVVANTLARVALVDAVNYAQERQTFGQALARHQVIRHKFAEMARHIHSTQAYIEQTAWRVQNGEQAAADTALCKLQATQTLELCAREAAQVLGGAAVIRGNKIERIYREARILSIAGGSEEILRDLAVRQMGI